MSIRKLFPWATLVIVLSCNGDITGPPTAKTPTIARSLNPSDGQISLVAVDAGAFHTCAINSARTVVCWGDNSQGQSNVPSGLSSVQQIAAGGYHTCALSSSGDPTCWGLNNVGQAVVPAGLADVVQLSSGSFHNCGLKADGTVTCWGANGNGESSVPVGLSGVSRIDAGGVHTCAIKTNGQLVCWGKNTSGQSTVPADIGAVSQVGLGAEHTCAVQVNGHVRCWGLNTSGQTSVPADLDSTVQVAAGAWHSCALSAAGAVRCWGSNANGELNVPADVSPAIRITAGTNHTCAIREDVSVLCWGSNGSGQVTIPSDFEVAMNPQTIQFTSTPPSPATVGQVYVVAATGGGSGKPVVFESLTPSVCDFNNDTADSLLAPGTCTISASQDGGNGFLAAEAVTQSFNVAPPTLPIPTLAPQLTGGDAFACALKSDGTVSCWGENSSQPPAGSTFVQISSGGLHSCGLKSDGTVLCWGQNNFGQSDTPPLLNNIVQVIAGYNHSCALRNDGTVTCWGQNSVQQTDVPPTLSSVTQISTSASTTCARQSNSSITCWGDNGKGQATVPPFTSADRIAVGGFHTCAILNGNAKCWGSDDYSQLKFPSVKGTAAIYSLGYNFSCRLNGGAVSCYGDNSRGQTTIPQLSDSTQQIAAGGYHACVFDNNGVITCWGGLSSPPASVNVYGNQPQVISFTSPAPNPGHPGTTYIVSATGGGSPSPVVFSSLTPDVCTASANTIALNAIGTCTVAANQAAATGFLAAEQVTQSFDVLPSLSLVASVQAGNLQTCALSPAGAIKCWAESGDAGIPTTTDIVQLSMGSLSFHACALKSNAAVVCWGDNAFGRAAPPQNLGPVKEVSAGGKMTCALRFDDSVTCWGSETDGELIPPAGMSALHVSAGGDAFACALKTDHTVACWGFGGDGRTTVPAGLINVQQVSAGGQFACALTTAGSVVCWGPNSSGQVNVPANLTNVQQVSAGGAHACAVKNDGTVACWGANTDGQATPPENLSNVVQVTAGAQHTCARRADEKIICWGSNASGQSAVPAELAPKVQSITITSSPAAPAFTGNTYNLTATGGASGNPVVLTSLTPTTCTVSSATASLVYPGTCTIAANQASGNGYDAAPQVTQSFDVVPNLQRVASVAAGKIHTCVLGGDGVTTCWGASDNGRSTPPAGIDDAVQLSIGSNSSFACVLRSNATLACWGANGFGEAIPPANLPYVKEVSAGGKMTCALRFDDTVTCWGSETDGELIPPAGMTALHVSAGGDAFACALKTDHTVACWGFSGDGRTTVPVGLVNVQQISAGGQFACAVTSSGSVRCWGPNTLGQIDVPQTLSSVTQVAAGGAHACALKSDGTVTCWGLNTNGQATPPANLRGVEQISAGDTHTCAKRTDGKIVCWGSTSFSQSIVPASLAPIAQAISITSVAPQPGVTGLTYGLTATGGASGNPVVFTSLTTNTCTVSGATVSLVAPGACTIAADQAGGNGYDPAPEVTQSFNIIVQLSVPTTLPQITSGGFHSCALRADGSVLCWGRNIDHQSTVPASLASIARISGGGYHNCAIRNDGTVQCWGLNDLGQSTPPAGLSSVARISAGSFHTCAIKTDASLVCWGWNGLGQISIPSNLGQVVDVGSGDRHTCAVKVDGTVACWGSNETGQIVVPANLTGVTQVASGSYHSCARKSDGHVVCWGANEHGQSSVPASLSNVVEVATGARYSCARKSDGTMQCWGSNDEGELIIPAAASSLSQISTGYFHTCVLRSDNVPLCWGRNDDGQSNVPNALKLSDKLQFIDFNPAPNPATVGTFFTVSATGGASGNPVTFSSLTPSICTTSGAQVQLVALGVCSIAANQAGSGDYIDAQQVVLNVDVTSPTDFLSRCGHAITGIAFDGTSYFVGEGHNSLDQCVSRYSPTGALLETKHFQVDIRGLHYLPASGLLTSRTWGGPIYSLNYSAGTQQSFTGFDAVPGIEQSQPAADPDGTSFWILDVPGQTAQRRSVANDTLIASFRITGGLASAPAIAVSNALVFVPNGLSVIAYDKVSGEVVDTIQVPSSTEGCSGYGFGASAAGDRIMYSSACNIAHVKLITPVRTQSISFTSSVPNPAFVGSTYIVTATGGASGNPIVFTASPDSVCTVSGNTVTMVSAGDCTVVAHQAGGNNYLRAPNQTQRFTITKMSQSISFTSTPSTPTFGGSYVVAATGGGSGNPVVFSSTTPSTCTVAGAAVSFVGAGSCTIAANQGGNATYDAAPVATQSFSIAKASQVISFTSVPPSPARLDGSYTPVASSQAGLPVVFSATGSCSVNGATVVMTAVGQCIVQATANGNANYLSGSTTQSFNVFYLFTGFASPIVNAPAVNAAKAGSVIKIQFSLAGNRGLNVIASGSPVSGLLTGACNVAGSPTAVTQAIPAIDLKYDPTTDQYAYSWQTDAAWAGTCRQFSMLLSDGSVHLAHFQFDVAKKPSVVLTVSPTTATAGIQSSHTFTIDIVSPTAIQGITGIPCALPAIASGALTYKQSCIMTTKFATAGSPTYTAQVALQGQASPTLSNAVSINVATPPAPVLTYSANPTTVQVGVAATITYSFSITSATVITGVLSSGCVIPPPAPGLTSYSGTCTTTVTYPKTGKTGYIVSASVEGRSGYTSSNTVTITVTK